LLTTDPGHYWDGRLGTGAGLPVDQAVILRPALPSPPSDEYSRFYIEDGSGRITQLVQRSDQTERVFAYIGLQPDWRSVWLSNEWDGHFVLNHDMYDRDDDVLGAPGTRSDES
jgi:hypothetical protein